jgi:hypothetical protein
VKFSNLTRLIMPIFDPLPRHDINPKQPHETAFGYLNRSGRANAGRVRELVETWLERYPAAHREALVGRLRSKRDRDHHAAFFELFVHELLLTGGHTILAIEPILPHTPYRPDFLIKTQHGQRVYMECTIATGTANEQLGAEARLNAALSAIEDVNSPTWFLSLKTDGLPTAPMKSTRLRSELVAWLAALPEGYVALTGPPFVYSEHGATISLRISGRRNVPGRAVGIRNLEAKWCTDHLDIRAKVEEKATRYDPLEHPYVVAVNALSPYADKSDAVNALLGDEAITITTFADGTSSTEYTRTPDGIWRGPQGARRVGLSGVLSFEQVTAWSFAAQRGRLIRNPWAKVEVGPFELGVDEFNPVSEELRLTPGRALGSIFGLSDGWPGFGE